jgi:hypothetical protein
MSVVIPTEERALAVTGVMGEGRGRTARPGRSSAARVGEEHRVERERPAAGAHVDDHPPLRWLFVVQCVEDVEP